MKILKIILATLVLLSLFSCGTPEEEENAEIEKFPGFESGNNIKNTNKNNVNKPKEVVFLEDKANTGKEKIDFIKDKIKNDSDVFKDRGTLNRSLDVALDYLDEKKKGSESKESKKEAEETKVLIEELIEEQLDDSMEEAFYEGELEKIEENYEEAIEKFEEAFEKADTDEERAQALAGEAGVYEEMGDDEQAEETYEEALEYDEDNVDANIGNAKYDIDDDLLDEAEENLGNINTEDLVDEQAIAVEVLKALIMTLRGEYRNSDITLLNAIDNYGEHIDIYMLLIENNYFFSLFFFLDSVGLPIEQTAPVLESYQTKGLEYYNKALELDANRVYAHFYYGASKYLLGDKVAGMGLITQGALGVDNDTSLNTQAKKDTYLDYVDVVEKINTYNTTFDYTPEQFDAVIEEKKGIFEKFYRMIDKDKLDQLTVEFQN